MAELTKRYAEREVNHIYESLVEDLEGCMLYGRRISEFEDINKALLVAAYFKGMFPPIPDPTTYEPPIPIFEL
jgi:hypothetical protein